MEEKFKGRGQWDRGRVKEGRQSITYNLHRGRVKEGRQSITYNWRRRGGWGLA